MEKRRKFKATASPLAPYRDRISGPSGVSKVSYSLVNKRNGLGDPFETRFGKIHPKYLCLVAEAWLHPTYIVR